MEIYPLVVHRKSAASKKLMDLMTSYFNKIAKVESKLGITDSILKISETKLPVSKVSSSKRHKPEPTQQQQKFELLINTELPAGVPIGEHGKVITTPEHEMFYPTFTSGMRFYRAADLNLTDSETLLRMYHVCTTTSNDLHLSSLMLEEINKRKDEVLIKKFFRGELDIKPRNN